MATDDPAQPGSGLEPPHHRAEIVFGAAAFGAALVLLALLGRETTWVNGQPLTRQPGFWPAVSIGGMVLFGAAELIRLWLRERRSGGASIGPELVRWVRAGEFVAWFMAYVWLVPQLGYLPVTLIFCAALAWRLGYRSARMIWVALVTGLTVVVVFKSLLKVSIPGGAVYEALPEAARNFMILYL
ncbi:MAG: tripartite tricarboxylate transporter TctB family protein [Pseudomonadota bacterium]